MAASPYRVLLLAALAAPAPAVELHIQFGAIERMLTAQAFTEEGRRYVRGDKSSKCNFAYLEKPEVQGSGGKLRIRARFSGRSSLNLFGQCVGMGDAFDIVITTVPKYRDGALRLQDVRVTADGKTGFYVRRVCIGLESSLTRDFQYPLTAAARTILENPAGVTEYPRDLRKFDVTEMRVTDDALVLVVDFELTVK